MQDLSQAPNSALEAALAELEPLFGTRLSRAVALREQHARDMSWHVAPLPDAVVFVQSTAEVQAVMRICHRHAVPVIAFGAGSSLEGHIHAPKGGISLDLSGMNRILQLNAEDLDVTVEAGVTREALNAHLRDTGLFFPIDPGANATLGGMAATRASGTNAVRYGTMATNVLALEVVLPDGRLIRTGTRARKSAAGYDLTHLFVGSEGTLGVITAVTLRLYGIPETISAAVCAFDSLEGAVQTTILAIQIGIPMARIELLDEVQIAAVNQDSGLGLPEAATLFLEFHGSPEGVAEQVRLFGELAEANGGQGFRWATATEERTALWKARHHALFAAKGLRPGCEVFISDVCVPISAMAGAIVEVQRDIRDNGLTAPILGHVGDGNFHVLFLMDPADADEIARIKAVNGRMIDRALAVGGTCTGEHGVGVGKKAYLRKEQGEAVDLMAAIKAAIDPSGIMNPGKIFDPLP
ncbi:FAD-binding oxidoreductase [Xinfangfangia pollutisoli]|uniref:FAD-binding oxidoreductase n=1 Tax=Xinfangfangia pollutisoli TaxID=2865960 RepID=UPI001CD34A04|nr:FAD-linked oxidase C-terminal domain-containing protein [Xinfangfangia pollutisoli]